MLFASHSFEGEKKGKELVEGACTFFFYQCVNTVGGNGDFGYEKELQGAGSLFFMHIFSWLPPSFSDRGFLLSSPA